MGERINIDQHKAILVFILKDIYTDVKLATRLGFKGGTALYFFYDLNRFSVDLDFDLLDRDDEEMVYKKLLEIISSYGDIKDSAVKNFGSLISLSYEKGKHYLKVDVSNRDSGSSYEVKSFMGVPLNVMKLEDMAANKLIALTDRKKPANRDLFDTYFLLRNFIEFNETVIQARSGVSLKEQIIKAIEHVQGIDPSSVLNGLGELVDDKQKIWIKNKLHKELLFQLRLKLDSLTNS